jgi:hypothetical protein
VKIAFKQVSCLRERIRSAAAWLAGHNTSGGERSKGFAGRRVRGVCMCDSVSVCVWGGGGETKACCMGRFHSSGVVCA